MKRYTYKDFTKEQMNKMKCDEIKYWGSSGGWYDITRAVYTSLSDYMHSSTIYLALVRIEGEWCWLYSKGAVEYGLDYLD